MKNNLLRILMVFCMVLFIKPIYAEIFCVDFSVLNKKSIITHLRMKKIPYQTLSIYSGKHEKNGNDIVEAEYFIGCKFNNSKLLLASYSPIQIGYIKKSVVLQFEESYYCELKKIIESETKTIGREKKISKNYSIIEWNFSKNKRHFLITLSVDKFSVKENNQFVISSTVGLYLIK